MDFRHSAKSSFVGAAFLAGFALLATILVAYTYDNTKENIALNERNYLLKNLNALVGPQLHDNDLLNDVLMLNESREKIRMIKAYRARLAGNNSALIMEILTRKGYGGPIKLLVACKPNGELLGVRVVSHKETPGLGDGIEVERSNWIQQFAGKSLQRPLLQYWKVKKDQGLFDQMTGATITPRAVVDAVKHSLLFIAENHARLFAPVPKPQAIKETIQ